MRAAIVFHRQGLTESGEPIPEPSGPGVYVEGAAARTSRRRTLHREDGGFPAATAGAVVRGFPDQHASGVELFEAPAE